MKEKSISIIVAVAADNAIGKGNSLLWHIRADLMYFKEKTLGHPVIMGRRTFESIGRPLPGRSNIVLTSKPSDLPASDNLCCVTSVEEALEKCGSGENFVIGGAQIYAAFLPLADKLYITRVVTEAADADAFFPAIDPSVWHIESVSETSKDPESGLEYRFEILTKKSRSDRAG